MDHGSTRLYKVGHEALRELKQFAVLSAYLYVCFGAIILYTVSVLQAHGINYEPYGFALIKALITAKFMLIGESIDIARFHNHRPLIYSLIYKSLIYLIFLIALSIAEEFAAGLIHGRSAIATLSEIGGGTRLQIVPTAFLLWLILLPIVGIQEVSKALGAGVLHRMFFAAK